MASLANKTIKHQIAMRGQFTRIAKQAALHLQTLKVAVKAELDEAMTARNWTAVARLRKTFVTIDKLINDEYELMSDTLKRDLGDLFVYESEFTSKLLGFDFTSSMVTEKLVESIVSSDPFDGKILGEWLDEQKLATQIKVKQTIRLAESFFQLLKRERIRRKIYGTRDEARSDIFDYIEMFYNPKRRHSSAMQLSPVEYEKRYFLSLESV